MASYPVAPCPHLSLPVETDESMTSSSLNLAWPACQKCSAHVEDFTPPSNDVRVNDRWQVKSPDFCSRGYGSGLQGSRPSHPVVCPAQPGTPHMPHYQRTWSDAVQLHPENRLPENASARFQMDYQLNLPSEDEESLEPPLPLRSDVGGRPGPTRSPLYAVGPRYHPHAVNMPMPPTHKHMQVRPMPTPQDPTRVRDTPDVMREVYVPASQPIRKGRGQTQEIRRTISLPDDCRSVFITYSVDVAKEIIPFVTFLINQGFRPAIDIFDNAVRQMSVTKWMDGYLKDKSVLIIMVISPKYKIDIEGDGSDQHGLHTKYIHSQLQNEFIQQRCLNFRLVPVLFPNANQSHVPLWLQSTRVFRWPDDAQDLLLRLLREERYIAPPLGRELTLSIRPL